MQNDVFHPETNKALQGQWLGHRLAARATFLVILEKLCEKRFRCITSALGDSCTSTRFSASTFLFPAMSGHIQHNEFINLQKASRTLPLWLHQPMSGRQGSNFDDHAVHGGVTD